MNSLTKLADILELSDSSNGKHFSIRIKSPTAFATPIPSTRAYAGSVFVISEERLIPSVLILTVTRCPIVGATTTDEFG